MANELTSLANVKSWLGVAVPTDDALLTRLITAYSNYVQSWLNRLIASQAYTEKRSGKGGTVMVFADYPVTAVSSVTINGQSIPAIINFGDVGYSFDDGAIYLNGYCFTRAPNNVVLQYTAGYASTPPELEQAVIELIATRYKERDRIGQNSKSLAGETVSFMVKDFPMSVQTILNNYKKVISL